MATLTFSGLPSGVVQTSMDNVTYTEATSPITLVDGMYISVSSSWQLIGQPKTYVNSVYVNENENNVWNNSRENPFILTYGGTLNYTTSSTQTATSPFIAKYVEQPKTTLDLSTLSDITVGTHTVKVKAKADGYRDSEFSNEVSYTKSSGYTVTFTRAQSGMNGSWQYTLNDGAVWASISQSATPIVVENVSQIKFRTKSFSSGYPYETYMTWDNPTGRIDCKTGAWVVSDTITPTGNMSVTYYGDNNPV